MPKKLERHRADAAQMDALMEVMQQDMIDFVVSLHVQYRDEDASIFTKFQITKTLRGIYQAAQKAKRLKDEHYSKADPSFERGRKTKGS